MCTDASVNCLQACIAAAFQQWWEEDDEAEEEEAAALERKTMMVLQVAATIGTYRIEHLDNRNPNRTPNPTGYQWVMDTLAESSDCYDMFRMDRPVFEKLHDLLLQSYGLKSTRRTTSVESLAMFLWMVGSPQSFRQAKNRFYRSMETVSRKFDKVLESLVKLAGDIICLVDPEFRTPHRRVQNPLFAPFFDNCIGAIDGTHIEVVVPKKEFICHLNRKSVTSQNVLAICDFDLRFTFTVTGWPGSVHDMRVFKTAREKFGDVFPHPPAGKFSFSCITF